MEFKKSCPSCSSAVYVTNTLSIMPELCGTVITYVAVCDSCGFSVKSPTLEGSLAALNDFPEEGCAEASEDIVEFPKMYIDEIPAQWVVTSLNDRNSGDNLGIS